MPSIVNRCVFLCIVSDVCKTVKALEIIIIIIMMMMIITIMWCIVSRLVIVVSRVRQCK